ncbi:MAG: hypothetical protein HY821_18185 [Acidobacteria bacterium]|nr:hypothetical protein [Acidobacteriota bacterium]
MGILLCLPLPALDNSVTIHDAAAAAQTARPVLIHRWFARGEIASYAKPRVAGAAPGAWQCDVKARWDDGSVRLAYVSWRQDIAGSGSVTADFVNDTNRSSAGDDTATDAAALDQAGMLAFDTGGGSGSWNGIVEGTLNSISYTANAKTMLAAGTWRYYLRGPVVTWAIAEDRTAALSYDFGWQYSGGSWQAPSASQYKSLHPIIMVQFWPASGTASAWPGVEVEAILWNASTTRLQRIPLDRLRVLTGAAGTTESYCAGTGCTITSAGTPNMITRRTWHTVQWSGTAPSAAVVDFNFAYMVYSRALLPYDTSLNFAQSKVDGLLSTYDSRTVTEKPEWCTPASGNCALWLKYIPNTGGRGDIAPIPQWYAYYLYGMGNAGWTATRKLDVWNKLLVGNADAATSYPIHYWESDASRTSYFGKTVNADSRPTVGLCDREKTTDSYVAAADAFDPVCSTAPCDGSLYNGDVAYTQNWTRDLAHQPSFFFLPALLTGRPFYIWEQYFLAQLSVQGGNPWRGNWNATSMGGACASPWYGSGSPMGMRSINNEQLRGASWTTRDIWLGAAIANETDAEAAYFASKLRNIDAAWEGYFNVTDGLYAPADTTCAGYAWDTETRPWCIGRKAFGEAAGASDLRITHFGSTQVGNPNGNHSSLACGGMSVWQHNFLLTTFAWANQSGVLTTGGSPVFKRTLAEASLFSSRTMMDEAAYPPAIAFYVHPTTMLKAGVGKAPANRTEMNTLLDLTGTTAASMGLADTTFQFSGAMAGEANTSYGWLYSQPIGVVWVESEAIVICKLTGSPRNGVVTATVCPSGRGALGTTATTHASGAGVRFQHLFFGNDWSGGYTTLARAGLAVSADASTPGYASTRAALERIIAAHEIINSNTDPSHGSPMWTFQRRPDPADVRASAASGTVTLRYSAPDLGACKYTVAGALADSSDGGDTSDGGGAVARTVSVSGLGAGPYRFRITCGTGRVIGTVQ